MKTTSTLLIIIILSITSSLFSQPNKMEVTAYGLSESIQTFNDIKDEYTLLKKTTEWINYIYGNRDKNLSYLKVDDKFPNNISLNGLQPEIFYYNSIDEKIFFDVMYKLKINIVGNSVTFSLKIVRMSMSNNYTTLNFRGVNGFYKNNGELRAEYEDSVQQLSEFFNKLIISYYGYLTSDVKLEY